MAKQLVIRPEKCVNCRTCELVCSFGHKGRFSPGESAVKVLDFEEAALSLPVMCLQCEQAFCLAVCPKEAISRDASGATVIDPEKCIGCKKCVKACPYDGIRFLRKERRVFKCDLCGGEPKCAAFCPTQAIAFAEAGEAGESRAEMLDKIENILKREARA